MPAGSGQRLRPRSWLVIIMAMATGVAVANLYYAQPLLDSLAASFGVSAAKAGLIVTATQLGFAAGLAFVVPLGDLVERRRLITLLSAGTTAALVSAALAPDIYSFLLASLVVGLTAVMAQVLVPFAAQLAEASERGRVVGQVMTGLLLGILLARTISGAVADLLGWRAVFWLAAGIMFVQVAILYRALPRYPSNTQLTYRDLLLSVGHLVRDEPTLRRRIVYGALGMGAFSAFWTGMPFLLARAPYDYSDTVIGLFGLLGAAGALCASFAGRLHDAGRTSGATGVFIGLISLSFVLMGLFADHLAAIITGIILLDVGQQGMQILNQSTIYQLRSEAQSRITTAYMTCFFLGGVGGSAGAAFVFELGGWTAVAILGATLGAAAFTFWLTEPPASDSQPAQRW